MSGINNPPEAAGGAAMVSTIVVFTRTGAAGSGAQAVTGVGFVPTKITFFACGDASSMASWGASDDALGEQAIQRRPTDAFRYTNVAIQVTDGTNGMVAVLTTYDADGFTVTWTESGTFGGQVDVVAVCEK